MDQREYSQLCSQLEGKKTTFSVEFLELGILLGAIRLMLDHPEFQAYGPHLQAMVASLRETILEAYHGLGLTTEQIHDLNTMYTSEGESEPDGGGNRASRRRSRRSRLKSSLKVVSTQEKEE